jgi:transposase
MMTQRRKFSAEFKAKVALEANRGERTLAELAKQYDLHPNQITQWKKQLTKGAATLFACGKVEADKTSQAEIQTLHAKIGQLTVEKDFLKKGLGL